MPRSFGGFGRPASERIASTVGFLVMDEPMRVQLEVAAEPVDTSPRIGETTPASTSTNISASGGVTVT